MNTEAFDILEYVHKLETAGVSRENAEAQARAQTDILIEALKNLVTKDELKAEMQILRIEMQALETRLITRMYVLHGATIAILFTLFKLF